MRVLVIGGTSGIGLGVVHQALDAGLQVRVLARSADRLSLNHNHLQTVAGSVLDSESLAAALVDVDVVVMALGVPFNWQLLAGPITLFSEATEHLLNQMQRLSVNRLIAVTGFGAGDCAERIHWLQKTGFNLVFGRAYADKSEQEALIKQSSVTWTLVRPGVLTNGPASGDYRVLVDPAEWRNGIISRVDVADFIVQQCQQQTLAGCSPVLIRRPL